MSKVTLTEMAADVDTPASGQASVYAKAAGFFVKNSAGVVQGISRPDATLAEAEAGAETDTRNFSPFLIKKAIDSLQVGGGNRSIMFGANGASNGSYSVNTISTNGQGTLAGHVPADLVSITKVSVVGIVSAGADGSGKDIDFTTEYAAVGEASNTHTQTDTTSTYNLTGTTGQVFEFDITALFASLVAEDFFGVLVKHNAIGGNIDYIGVELHYSAI